MVSNLQLGDVYWTENGYGGISDYVFVARQGQFIIGVEEEYGCRNRIVDQLHRMCEETLEEDGVDMYVHYANKCYPTYEDAETIILGSEDWDADSD